MEIYLWLYDVDLKKNLLRPLDLEIWSNVAAHSLIKSSVYVKYKLYRTKGNVYMNKDA